MTQEQIETIITFFMRYGFEAAVSGCIVFLLIKYFLPVYLSQKGKNLATKEDITNITEKIEEVKSQYTELLENLKAKHQLRLAAIDRRLEVHQEAYGLWRKINGSLGTGHIGNIIKECDEWWGDNSLYLDPAEPREAFLKAWVAARDLKIVEENSDPSLVTEYYKTINQAGEAITKAIELPQINELIDK